MTIKFKLKNLNKDSFSKGNLFSIKFKLASLIQKGMEFKDAAKMCKLTDLQISTLMLDHEFEEFICNCTLNCEYSQLKNINEAGKLGQWQASAWMLERRFPNKYGKKDTIRHEYEFKLISFQKILLGIINELDPNIKQIIMQKLRAVDVDEKISDFYSENNNVDSVNTNLLELK